jgi:short-subunit dehydrogenase
MAPSSTSVRSGTRARQAQRQLPRTKGHLLKLSLRLQQEVAGKGVRVQVVLPGATRTAIWEKAGTDIASLPPNIVMDVDDMVDAALVRLDRGEGVTVPSLDGSRC